MELGTRAVLRKIVAGSRETCCGCGGWLRFVAKKPSFEVVCNVYVGGKWDRVEHWHESCYGDAGSPHGKAE
jgi:hypothetical protein